MKWTLLLLALATASAQERKLAFDPAKTKIEWTLGGSVHTTHGTFALKSGSLTVGEGGTASGEVVVDAKSGESGNGSRDERMHKLVLESAKFPEIRLKVEKVEGIKAWSGVERGTVRGKLDIHGATHDVAIPFETRIEGETWKTALAFEVPYVEWGMKDPGNFLLKVEKKVTLKVVAEGRL